MIAVMLGGCASGFSDARQNAALLADKGRYDEAAEVLRADIQKHPPAVEDRRLLIRVLALTGNLGAAQHEAEELGDVLGKASPVPWIEMGHAYELTHRYDQALAMYDRAADVAPQDEAGPREGGMRAARWGELELAKPRLEEALRRNPKDAAVWHALGLVRLRQGDSSGARQAYDSGLQADPGALENRVGLATLALKEHQPAEALRQYDAIIAARPRFADAQLGRSLALLELGRLDEAEQALDQAQRLGADSRVVSAQRRLLRELRQAAQVKQNR